MRAAWAMAFSLTFEEHASLPGPCCTLFLGARDPFCSSGVGCEAAKPATALTPICGGQGWVLIVTFACHQVRSRRDLQGKYHPRNSSGNRRAKNRIRRGLQRAISASVPLLPLPVPNGTGTRVSLPQEQEKSPGSSSQAKGCPQPWDSESVPTWHQPSPCHRARSAVATATGLSQTLHPVCWSRESTGAGTRSPRLSAA